MTIQTINNIINNEIFMNVSQLVTNVIAQDECLTERFWDEAEGLTDWDTIEEILTDELESNTLEELLYEFGYDSLKSLREYDLYGFIELCEQYNIYTIEYEKEVVEYWAVSKWLFSKLVVNGAAVTEFEGMYIWLRTTSGQAIKHDYIWETIGKVNYKFK